LLKWPLMGSGIAALEGVEGRKAAGREAPVCDRSPETGRQRQSRRPAAAVVCLEIRLLGKNKRVIYFHLNPSPIDSHRICF